MSMTVSTRPWRSATVAVALLTASFGYAHAQTSPAVAATPQGIVEAAIKEGSVTWYANPGFRDNLREPLAAFRKQYPAIDVRIVEGTGGDVMERIRAERRAGRLVADIFTAGDIIGYAMIADNAVLPIDLAKVPNAANLAPRLRTFVGPENKVIPTTMFVYGMAVNTRALPEADHPKKWADLVQPKYAGKIGLHDFGRLGGGNTMLGIGLEPLGKSFFENLMKQQPRVFAAPQELEAALVRGERAIAVPGRTRIVKDYAGAPVKFILPEDGTYFVPMQSGILAGSQHPNAAYLFLNFLLDKPAQERFAALGDGPVISGLDSVVNLEKAAFLGRGAIGFGDLQRQKDIQALGQSLVQAQR